MAAFESESQKLWLVYSARVRERARPFLDLQLRRNILNSTFPRSSCEKNNGRSRYEDGIRQFVNCNIKFHKSLRVYGGCSDLGGHQTCPTSTKETRFRASFEGSAAPRATSLCRYRIDKSIILMLRYSEEIVTLYVKEYSLFTIVSLLIAPLILNLVP